MDEQKVREILGSDILENNGLYSCGQYLSWTPGGKCTCLDGDFTAEELEAIAWWMKHYG